MIAARVLKLAALLTTITAARVCAHHSTAMFDWGWEERISGVVKEFQWTNPHSWIVLEVRNEAGETEEWNFEGMSPNYLGRHGWTKRSLQPGDEIEMGYYPLKDGRKGGFTVNVQMPGGSVLRELPSESEL
jgi:hypothetical protein